MEKGRGGGGGTRRSGAVPRGAGRGPGGGGGRRRRKDLKGQVKTLKISLLIYKLGILTTYLIEMVLEFKGYRQ